MREIIQQDQPFHRQTMTKEEAKAFFSDRDQEWKVELVEGLEDQSPTVYQIGEFSDLCRGPHVLRPGKSRRSSC